MSQGSSCRIERDSLGTVEVPSAAYYGAQTARAIGNFPISGISVGHFPAFVREYIRVAHAAKLFVVRNARLQRIRLGFIRLLLIGSEAGKGQGEECGREE